MVGLMPADDVRRRPSPNARPVGVRVAAPVGSPQSTLMTEGRYGLTSVIISEVRRSHNTAGGHWHTGPEPIAGAGGAANAHRRGAQHQNPPQGGAANAHRRGAQHQNPPQGGAASAHRRGAQHRRAGGPQGGTTPRGAPAHKRAGPTRQQHVSPRLGLTHHGVSLALTSSSKQRAEQVHRYHT